MDPLSINPTPVYKKLTHNVILCTCELYKFVRKYSGLTKVKVLKQISKTYLTVVSTNPKK